MRHVSMKAVVAVALFGALLGGCATTVEMGPGYYHYDTGLASTTPPVVYREPTVVYREPVVTYREPAVVYRSAPALVF
jgi:hypothetical protein